VALRNKYLKVIPKLRRIINNNQFHQEFETAVDIDDMVDRLKINIEETIFIDHNLQGSSIKPKLPRVRPVMFIDVSQPVEVQRKTKGHELTHILSHYKDLPLCSHIGNQNKMLEREANYGAAYLLIPTKTIHLALKWKTPFAEVAERMGAPLDLIFLRNEIYWELKEYEHF
jgi:Zn-dependent peptidase ImmA (M78 family)